MNNSFFSKNKMQASTCTRNSLYVFLNKGDCKIL